jgi:fumarate reductase subunit C
MNTKATSVRSAQPSAQSAARRQITYELLSGGTGLILALFMWGHVLLVGSILTGTRGFDWLAGALEDYYIAQPTIAFIFTLFLVHAALASRKIPAQLRERKQMLELAKGLNRSGREKVATRTEYSPFRPHTESLLWIWQVRTGMVMLVLGSFHLVLLSLDIFTPLYGDIAGIESTTTMARVGAGLWLPYAVLLLCVEFHASVGLYRLAVKWGADLWMSRETMHRVEQVIFWVVLGLGALTLVVLAGWVDPPLAFLTEGAAS